MEKQQPSQFTVSVCRSGNEIEAIYFKLKEGKILRTKEVGKNGEAIIDFGKNNEIIGIEMLEPGVSVRVIRKISKDYKRPEIRSTMEKLQAALT